MIRFNRGFVLQDAGGLESDRWAGYREKVFDQVVDKVQLFHFPVYIFPSLLVSDLGGTALDPARLTGPNFDVRCSMFNVGRSRTSNTQHRSVSWPHPHASRFCDPLSGGVSEGRGGFCLPGGVDEGRGGSSVRSSSSSSVFTAFGPRGREVSDWRRARPEGSQETSPGRSVATPWNWRRHRVFPGSELPCFRSAAGEIGTCSVEEHDLD